jgi:glucose-1-phosphate thymidylyltransferase
MTKGVILAGGHATRLYPLTKVTNKHLLPVGKVPMIYYPIARLLEGGIQDILVVTSRDHMGDIVNLLGSGSDIDVRFTYRVQDTAGGIAQALGLAEGFVGDDSCVVILGDNIYTKSFGSDIKDFASNKSGAKIMLKEVTDPGRYGVAELSGDGKNVSNIEEKPEDPKTNLAVTGCYFYDSKVFEIIKTLKPSGRGELEITDVNNYYIKQNQMEWCKVEGEWTDAGTFTSLLHANNIVKNLELPQCISAVAVRS